jgi:hypothetical protein
VSTVDWAILDEPGVQETCAIQARKVADEYSSFGEYGDFLQEAYIAVATHPRQFRGYIEDGTMGLFAHALWCDLVDIARAQARRVNREDPIDGLEFE